MDRFDRRLREELHSEFDSQAVVTPPPHRARYGQQARRSPSLRAMALVTAVFAIGILVGLAYAGGGTISLGPGSRLGVPVPSETPPPAPTTASTTRPPTASPSTSGRPAPSRRPSASPLPIAVRPGLADDFESDPVGANPPGGWQVDDGQWTGVVGSGGHVLRHGTGQPLAHLVTGSPRWSDYSVSADVRTDLLDLGFAGVAGRYQDPGNDYECGITVGGRIDLWVVKGGQRAILAVSGISLDLTGDHNIRLDMRGSQLTCSLDGTALLRANDTTFSAGRIALVASAGEEAEFDNVRVTD